MSDNWKNLLSQFGIPGPADPPETEKSRRESFSPAEPTPEPRQEPQHAPEASADRAAENQRTTSHRRRSSMWGDENESESSSAIKGTVPLPVNPLRELSEIKSEPSIPGFDAPSPAEEPKSPPRRSAWDTLISTLGIKSSTPVEPEPPAPTVKPNRPSVPSPPQSPAETWAKMPNREPARPTAREESAYTQSSERRAASPANEASGFGVGLSDDEGRSSHFGQRPPRRASSQRGFDGPEAPSERRTPELDRPPRGERRDTSYRGEAPRAFETSESVRSEPTGSVFDAEPEDDLPPRRRRSRRRGQRQRMGSDFDSNSNEPIEMEGPGIVGPVVSESGPSRGEHADRSRERHRERGRRETTVGHQPERPERLPARPSRRPPRREPDPEEIFDAAEEDIFTGFGEGLIDESPETEATAEGTGEELRRPRRRRGRRGRGRGNRPDVEGTSTTDEPIPAHDFESPGFDDDLEDDEEADRLRHRGRTARGDLAEDSAGSRRQSRPVAERPARDLPNWIDTVSVLVNANINRRNSGGGGGGPRGQQSGRGNRR